MKIAETLGISVLYPHEGVCRCFSDFHDLVCIESNGGSEPEIDSQKSRFRDEKSPWKSGHENR